jgi:hypothetical protein
MPTTFLPINPLKFESKCEKDAVLKLNQTFYALTQAASAFWSYAFKSLYRIGYQIIEEDPCMHFKWNNNELS